MSTEPSSFAFDDDGLVDTTNLFASAWDLREDAGDQSRDPHPLDTSLGDITFVQEYIRDSASGPLAEYTEYIVRCGDDLGCIDRVYNRMTLEEENRFNVEIFEAAQAYGVPPLLLKVLLQQESGLVPAMSPNRANASGIGQIVDWTTTPGGAAELVRLGRGVIPLPGGITILQMDSPTRAAATQYRDLIDGLMGSTVPPPNCQPLRLLSTSSSRVPLNETENCIDFEETVRAINDTAFLLWQNYQTIEDRIRQSSGVSFSPPLSEEDRREIIWTWAVITYNQGNAVYHSIPTMGTIASADIICALGAVTDEGDRYLGAILNGDPGAIRYWCQ